MTSKRVCNRCGLSQEASARGGSGTRISRETRVRPRAHGLQRRANVRLRPAAPGFSIVELMVVVTIISIVSALVMPSMLQVLRERKAQQAAVSVLDIVRETRSRAMYRGAAHTLAISTVGTSVRLDAWEGTSSSCRLSTFGGGLLDPTRRIYSLDLTTAEFTRDGVAAQLTVPAAQSYVQICFTPLGVALFSTTPIADGTAPSAVWSNDSATIGVGGSFVLDVYQLRAGAVAGVRRRVVIPLSGMPRMRT